MKTIFRALFALAILWAAGCGAVRIQPGFVHPVRPLIHR